MAFGRRVYAATEAARQILEFRRGWKRTESDTEIEVCLLKSDTDSRTKSVEVTKTITMTRGEWVRILKFSVFPGYVAFL